MLKLQNGTHIFDVESPSNGEIIAFYVAGFNASDGIVNATGTVSISVSGIAGQWHSLPSEGDAIIDLSTTGAIATYSPPVFLGLAQQYKIVVDSMAGAAYVGVNVFRKW